MCFDGNGLNKERKAVLIPLDFPNELLPISLQKFDHIDESTMNNPWYRTILSIHGYFPNCRICSEGVKTTSSIFDISTHIRR